MNKLDGIEDLRKQLGLMRFDGLSDNNDNCCVFPQNENRTFFDDN